MVKENASLLATITEKQEGKICFFVDEVSQAEALLPVDSVKLVFRDKCEDPLVIFSHDETFNVVRVLEHGYDPGVGLHPLVYVVHLAFSQHRPLLLTPDIVWLTIAQGFAHHINYNSEALRSRFVKHKDKLTLQIEAQQLSNTKDWSDAIDNWIEKIFTHIDPVVHKMMICDFTTTTSNSRTVSQIIIMDSFQKYFDYRAVCICGIPQITLKGTVEDWGNIKERVQEMVQYDLSWWAERLLPICDEFIATAEGKPNLAFWQSIYKPQDIYGGELINGWLADLFPYCKDNITEAPTLRNRIFTKPRTELAINDGISPNLIPVGLSQVPFVLETRQDKQCLKLVGGFIGVCQDESNRQLYPEIGWAVVEQDNFSQLLPIIEKVFTKQNSVDLSVDERLPEMPKELIQFLEEFGTGTFFTDTETFWAIRQITDFTPLEIVEVNSYVTQFIDLKDGRCVCYDFVLKRIGDTKDDYKYLDELWLIVGKPGTCKTQYNDNQKILEESVVIAKGFEQFFERMIQANGSYYFDLPEFVPDDTIDSMR